MGTLIATLIAALIAILIATLIVQRDLAPDCHPDDLRCSPMWHFTPNRTSHPTELHTFAAGLSSALRWP
jgi:hypothetical protein